MEELQKLNSAFQTFTEASKLLEIYYCKLKEQVDYLTKELALKNEELNHALEDSRRSRDFLKGLLENMQEAIIVLDSEERIIMSNIAAKKLLSLPFEEKQINFNDLNVKIEGNKTEYDMFLNDKKHNLLISKSEIRGKSKDIQGYVVLFQDITKIKASERQRERNKRLIAMGEMSAKIVHEIRSPLCSIELYASMLADVIENSEHRELAKGICTGIKSLNNILNNMLFYVRPHELKYSEIYLEDVILQTINMLKPIAEGRNIKIDFSYKKGNLIKGDMELLKQAFINVIINALQASYDGQKIDISINNDCKSVTVDIRDFGVGIKAEEIENIFNPFFTTKERGTGLGLTITSMIIEAHKGNITVESEPGKGCLFKISFSRLVRQEIESYT